MRKYRCRPRTSPHTDELQLHVVRVAEHNNGKTVPVVDRRVLNAEPRQALLPCVQVAAYRHPERDMVESGTRLREALTLVTGMGVQADAHRPVRLAEHDGVTLPVRMRLVHELGQLEDIAVPGHAALEVADRDGHVVDSGELRHGATVDPMSIGGN